MIKKISIFFCFVALIGYSCIDEINLGGVSESKRLIVEGRVTDQPGPYRVKLSYNSAYTSNPDDFITGKPENSANLTLVEVESNTSTPFNNLGAGIYETDDPSFIGIAGNSYFLNIEIDQEIYQSAVVTLIPVPEIDSLYTVYDEENQDLNVYVSTGDPEESGNYYRWQWEGYHKILSSLPGPPDYPDTFDCCTDCFMQDVGNDILIFQDSYINGNQILGQPIMTVPLVNSTDYLVEVDQLSLSKEEYEFWNLLSIQSESEGGLFDPPPFNIEGNVSKLGSDEKALGFFSASSITHKYLQVPRRPYFPFPDIISQTDCRTIPFAFTQIPDNWK